MSSIHLSLPGAAEPISEVIPLVNQAVEILRLRTCTSDEFKQMHALLSAAIEEFPIVGGDKSNRAISPNDAFWCRGQVAPPGTEFHSNQGSVNIEGQKFSYMRWAVNAALESDEYTHCDDVTQEATGTGSYQAPSDDSYEAPSGECSNIAAEKILLESLAPILEGLEDIARAHVCSEVEGPDGIRQPTMDPNLVVQYMKDLLSSGIEAVCPGSGDTKDQEYLSFLQEYRGDGHHLQALKRRVAESKGDVQTLKDAISGLVAGEDDFFTTHWWITIIVSLVCLFGGIVSGMFVGAK